MAQTEVCLKLAGEDRDSDIQAQVFACQTFGAGSFK